MNTRALAFSLFVAGAAVLAAQNKPQPAEPPKAANKARAATNSPIEITAQTVTHSNIAGVTIFTGNVKAWDDEMELYSRVMTVRFLNVTNQDKSVTRSIATIIADGDAVIVNKKDKSMAAADKAVYRATDDRVELTGDTLMESSGLFSTADLVIYDRAGGGVLKAIGNVRVVVDPSTLGRTNRFGRAKPEQRKEAAPTPPPKKGDTK